VRQFVDQHNNRQALDPKFAPQRADKDDQLCFRRAVFKVEQPKKPG
jgi:hypothetical protein